MVEGRFWLLCDGADGNRGDGVVKKVAEAMVPLLVF